MLKKRKFKVIKVMPDFSSSGVWNEGDEGVMIDLEDLEIPQKLKLLFIDWIELYEECWNSSYKYMNKKKAILIYKRGLQLAKQLKLCYPGTKIIYRGESDTGLHEAMEIC